MSLSARCFLTFSEFLDALASGRQQHTPHLSGIRHRSALRIRPVPAAMHGAISRNLCEIVPKRLSPAVHQTAQPARDPEQQHPRRERYDDQDHEEVRLSSEEVEHRTAFLGFQDSSSSVITGQN
jgi:hypothetical protein